MHTPRSSARGISLAEVSIMLMVMSTLSAVASPVIGGYVSDARRVQAVSDLNTLAVTFARFTFDARMAAPADRHWQRCDILVGEGLAPALAPGIGDAWAGEPGSSRVGRLEEHLQTNAVGYDTEASGRLTAGVRGWRGPYLTPGVGPDAWGHRYLMNVAGWTARKGALVVLSAGPNGIIETPFETSGATPGGDDLMTIVAPMTH